MTRKPSCLISCSQAPPDGGSRAFVGRQGAINPAGRVRSFNTGALIGDEHLTRQLSTEKDYLLLKRASASRPSSECFPRAARSSLGMFHTRRQLFHGVA